MRLEDSKPTERFAGREADYSMARPGYPAEVLRLLESKAGFSSKTRVADVGSGTGKLTALFLDNGNEVFAVEPNADMQAEAEKLLGRFGGFQSIKGTAESTGLPDKSVGLVSAGQAFHWFDKLKAKKEFLRILESQGFVLLVWNTRKRKKGSFSSDYEELIEEHKSDTLGWSSSEREKREISKFFARNNFTTAKFDNFQSLDFEHLLARIRSASYMPREGKKFEHLVESAKRAFAKHESRGVVTMEYDTEVYLGKLR